MKRWSLYLASSLALAACRPKADAGGSAALTDTAAVDAAASLDGPMLVARECLMCHEEALLSQQRLTPGQWQNVLTKMTKWGAELSAEENATLSAHLSLRYGVDAGPYVPAAVTSEEASARATPLDDGPFTGGDAARGAAYFKANCATCHGADARGAVGVNLVGQALLRRAPDLAAVIRHGRRVMVARPDLKDAEIADLITYLRTLRGT